MKRLFFPEIYFFSDATRTPNIIGKANVCDNQMDFTLHEMNVEFRRVNEVQSFTRKKYSFAHYKPAVSRKNNRDQFLINFKLNLVNYTIYS
jgi:hypothetical protein